MKFRLILVLLLFPAILSGQANQQEEDTQVIYSTDPRIGSYYQVFPLAGYTSDWGFFGGAFVQRINYGVHVLPFLSNAKADVIFSTKGMISSNVEYERIRTFGTSIRSRVEFTGERLLRGHYFGIGNNSVYIEDLFDEEFFYFENRELQISYQARKTIGSFGSHGLLDAFAETSFRHVNGLPRGDSSLYEEERPVGYGKNHITKIGFGLLADSRENEFIPTQGVRYEVGFKTGLPLFGSEFSFSDLWGDFRHYIQIYDGVVLAQKLGVEHVIGEAPFWGLAVLGTRAGLRGYHLDRFRGRSSVLNLVELRTWLFSIFDGDIRFGAQLFWDSGRVFSDVDSNGIFSDWKHSYGFGGAVSLFNPDFFMRGDIGFSDETYRIYIGAGYIF